MKKLILPALALALTAVSSQQAAAQPAPPPVVYWAMTGAQCQVDDNAQANALYSRTSGSIKFAAGKTGTIGLFCSVTKNNGATNPNQIWVQYQDTDGVGTVGGTFVLARFFAQNRTAVPTGIWQIGSTVTSGSPYIQNPITVDNRAGLFINHTLDFDNFNYFFYVELQRTSTAQQAILYGVHLAYQP